MNLQYNVAVELVSAFFVWTSWDHLKKTSRFEQIPEELQEWKKNLDQLFPTYSLEQAKPLASEFLLLIFSLLKVIVINSITTPKELLNYLARCNGPDLAAMVITGEDFPFSLEELLRDPEKGKEALSQSHGTVRFGEDNRFVDFLGHPDYYRNKLHIHLSDFYIKGFAPFQKNITKRMKDYLKIEKQEALANPDHFLKTRLCIKTEEINKDIPSVIFLSYYDCLDCVLQNEPSLAMYGWLNKESTPKPDIEEIYSLINDETRRNILKGLAEKAMFSREIAETWNLSPSTVSYHMTRFYMLGLIHHRSGPRKRVYHELNKERLSQLIDSIKTNLMGTEY